MIYIPEAKQLNSFARSSFKRTSLPKNFISAFCKTPWRRPMRIMDRFLGTGLSSASSTSCSSSSSHSSLLTSSWPSLSSPSMSSERQSWRTTWTRIRNLVSTSPSRPSPCSFMFPLRPLGSGIVLIHSIFSKETFIFQIPSLAVVHVGPFWKLHSASDYHEHAASHAQVWGGPHDLCGCPQLLQPFFHDAVHNWGCPQINCLRSQGKFMEDKNLKSSFYTKNIKTLG